MENIEKQLITIIEKLKADHHTISCAESCTGGRIAAAITAISGASAVFNGSVVSYSNGIKEAWLGVTADTLNHFGAVSQPCVEEMLEGILKLAKAEYAIAVSGIAGPTGGTPQKPVGTVYIGVATPTTKAVYHCHFQGTREEIQNQSTIFAIEKLARSLNL